MRKEPIIRSTGDFAMNRAVLIAAGEYRDEYAFSETDDVIAVDGGYAYILRQRLVPVLFVGDKDSYSEELPEDLEKILLPKEKDDTDSLYAIKELLKRGYRRFALYGFLGGSMAHAIANLQSLLYLKKNGGEALLFHSGEIYEILHDERKDLTRDGGTFSIFSLSESSLVSISGAKYPLNNYLLKNDFPIGIDNAFLTSKKASVKVHRGFVLIIYPES